MDPYEFDEIWKSSVRNSRIWLARNSEPSPNVTRIQRIIPARSPRSRDRTARIIVPLDAIRNTVKIAESSVSSSTPGGGHWRGPALRAEDAAKSPPPNTSAAARHATQAT